MSARVTADASQQVRSVGRGAEARSAALAVRVLLVYLAIRAVGAVMIAVAARDQVPTPGWTDEHVDYLDMAVLWDGSWYRSIALDGYPDVLPTDANGALQQNAWAFYPLYPLVCRFIMGLTGLSFPLVGTLVAVVCGAAAAVVMARLLASRVGQTTALLAVAAWAAFPATPALQIAYTEGPAMLVLCLFLWALMRRRWWTTAALAVVTGLTRPIAVPLAVVVAVALYKRWRRRGHHRIGRGEYVGGAVALGVTGLSGGLWPAIVWLGTGAPDGYTRTMGTWRSGGTVELFAPWLGMSRYVFRDFSDPATLGPVGLAVLVAALAVAVAGPWSRRLGWELRAWCLAYPAYLAAVLDPFTSIFRYLIPLFPLAVLGVGGGWPGHRPAFQYARAAALVLVGIWLQWEWITQLLVFVPPSDYPP